MARFEIDEIPPIDGYKLMSGLVVPRPIGWIGTRSADGVDNLAPYSFFNGVSSSPPAVMFAPSGQPRARKDSLSNARETGVFTVNIVDESLVEAMNATAATVDADVDEFEVAGVTKRDAVLVDAPCVAESPAVFECRVVRIVDLTDDGIDSAVVIGRVLAVEVSDRLLDGTRIHQHLLHPVGRHAGNTYSRITEYFDIVRPT